MTKREQRNGLYVSVRNRRTGKAEGHITLEHLTARESVSVLEKAERTKLRNKLNSEAA